MSVMDVNDLKARLTEQVDNEPEPEPNTEPAGKARQPKPNRYAGPCVECGSTVAEGSGYLAGKVDGRWQVVHADGDCIEAPETPSGEQSIVHDPANPYPGIYTVEDDEGHVTLRVYQQPLDEDFAPGKLIIERLTGADNESDYQGFGFITGGHLRVWKRHRNDDGTDRRYVAAARVLMDDPDLVLSSLNCPRCNAVLSHPDSISLGIGPECRKAWGWA